ncbi:MAG: hypothetical protein ACK5JT_12980 [Hyphomicrobiaceae bacterium]
MVDRKSVTSRRPRAAEVIAKEVRSKLDAGGDPRHAIRHLNAEIVAYQGAGNELPVQLIRLSRTITSTWVSGSRDGIVAVERR